MNGSQIDKVSRFFRQRRLSRRRALAQGGAGLAAAGFAATGRITPSVAQDATPASVAPEAEHAPEMLFVQSFRSGSIASKDGSDGRYTVTLEHGLGQTVYFSDRPDRIVGSSPTGQFLDGLGFPADNPPNAALVVEMEAGETEFAVVELFAPVYDQAGPTLTYEMAVLAAWESSSELGFSGAPTDLAMIAPSFGAAHLFIDGCSNHDIVCHLLAENRDLGVIPYSDFGGFCFSDSQHACLPCKPWNPSAFTAVVYWESICRLRFPECKDDCRASGVFYSKFQNHRTLLISLTSPLRRSPIPPKLVHFRIRLLVAPTAGDRVLTRPPQTRD